MRWRTKLVRFSRPFEQGTIIGKVLDVGPEFFMLALVADNVQYDGFQCFRIRDVRQIELSDAGADLFERALRMRGDRAPKKPKLNLESLEHLLRTAGKAFDLITIAREKIDPDICHIGSVIGVSKERLTLHEIGPAADWDDVFESYRLNEITQVAFGGGYEQALALVGGPAPKLLP
jgi:hypothetical protein